MRYSLWFVIAIVMVVMVAVTQAPVAGAEPGYDAWLRYEPIEDEQRAEAYRQAASAIVVDEPSPILESAAKELHRGLSGLLDQDVPVLAQLADAGVDRVVILTAGDRPMARAIIEASNGGELAPDGYLITHATIDDQPSLVIAGQNDRGALYGAFALLRHLQLHRPIDDLPLRGEPDIPMRMINHWDNLDGSVERGYAGRSIFHWDDLPDTLDARYEDYARLLASLGINAVAVNNVNVGKGGNTRIMSSEYIDKAAALAEVFRRYGVTYYLSVGFNAPRSLGGLETGDPLDADVRRWWADKADEIYEKIPDFGGFLIKADSEGEPGPYGYGRDHAEGANMLAEALEPHGGLVIWRAFVYQMDGTDRVAMADQHFRPLDGRFADNVIIQVKNGPLDFQVREPINPLFGSLRQTNTMLEAQITQEYTGHDIHLCYLVPMWEEILEFDTHVEGEGSTVAKIIDGSLFDRQHTGITAVLNIGEHPTWLGHHLHMANFHGYGRLAWDNDRSAEELAEEWVRLTFGHDQAVVETIVSMLMDSWEIYESYTSPMGLGVLHDVATHLDPKPHIRHYYHKADSEGVGFDRTAATGSGYVQQYAAPVAQVYETPETTPTNLLLFFHHLPYTWELDSGKTLIQHLYDGYFGGVEQAKGLRERWRSLEGKIDPERYAQVLAKFDEQIEHAAEWRDTMTLFFFELSGIPDENRRIRSDYRLRHRSE